ncbi:acVLRF1 family peptidyl-tRNA hydrolase [Pseudarthrobacter sp. P1]|uniref:acVLRF1 family peptidyl-tRNA hydrolase n=1 Tax=Pseudarthrobacter sp. P1 TaxID=3418418 RepID=UPI003CF3EC5A
MNVASRTARVSAARLPGWVERFAAGHGAGPGVPLKAGVHDDGVLLVAPDGATALLRAPWPVDGRPGRGADEVERLAALASQPRALGLVLVRRGGYAVGVSAGAELLKHKAGTRYVQSRSAAGGGSQQRFARRRANQADALVERVALDAAAAFDGHAVEYLALGGDKALLELVLAEPALKAYATRARLRIIDVPDPRAAVLAKAAADFAAVQILITDPPAQL